MKQTMKTGLAFILALLGLSILVYANPKDEDGLTISIAGDTYRIPKEYNPCCRSGPDQNGNYKLVMQFSKLSTGPLLQDFPGWDDNVNLLLSDFSFPVAQLYDDMWDGTPDTRMQHSPSRVIIRSNKINKNLLYQEMGGHTDIILVTDDEGGFDGFMQCDKYEIEGSANACQFLFNQGGKRWNVSFGKQFVKDYNQIRRDVIDRMDSFKITNLQ